MSDNYTDSKKEKKKGFGIRVRSAVLLTLIAMVTIIPGGYYLLGVTVFISFLGMYEFLKVVKIQHSSLAIVAYICVFAMYAMIFFDKKIMLIPLILFYTLALFTIMVFSYPKYSANQVLMAATGLVYISLSLSFLYQTRMQVNQGAFLVWLIFICSWISDSGAYIFGITMGKHKAFPVLSPKKSVEGCIGGIFSSVLIGTIYWLVLRFGFNIEFMSYIGMVIVCACGAAISQVGDLTASAFKRNFEIKDYGNIIPGHGGIMDRFDSIIFVAPIVYYLGKLFV